MLKNVDVNDFIKLLDAQVDTAIYVWGGNGEDLCQMTDPIKWISGNEDSATNYKRAVNLFEKRLAAGKNPIRAFDCSGLIYWALRTLGILKKDISSRGLYKKCRVIEQSDLQRGDLVFIYDEESEQIVHVGAYVGDGYVIDARGRDVGVVRTKLAARKFNRFGRLPGVFIDHPEIPEGYHVLQVVGGRVHVRAGDNKYTKKIKTVLRGDIYPIVGRGASGWWEIEYSPGMTGYISDDSKYTRVVIPDE
ncbi:MAG: C40 family peptidase [Rikenellaceae bacterium]|nr:C40 family peptidase [Rikenellaceae bacterium]